MAFDLRSALVSHVDPNKFGNNGTISIFRGWQKKFDSVHIPTNISTLLSKELNRKELNAVVPGIQEGIFPRG